MAFNTREENAADLAFEEAHYFCENPNCSKAYCKGCEDNTPHIQGVCRDCGNGTLNNDLNPAFELEDYPHCLACGSTHLDIL